MVQSVAGRWGSEGRVSVWAVNYQCENHLLDMSYIVLKFVLISLWSLTKLRLKYNCFSCFSLLFSIASRGIKMPNAYKCKLYSTNCQFSLYLFDSVPSSCFFVQPNVDEGAKIEQNWEYLASNEFGFGDGVHSIWTQRMGSFSEWIICRLHSCWEIDCTVNE